MTKRLRNILSIWFIVLGIAMVVFYFAYQPSMRLITILGCAYAVLGYGAYGALSAHGEKKWREITSMVLLGFITNGISWFIAVVSIVFSAGKILLTTDEEEAAKNRLNSIKLPQGNGILIKTNDSAYYQLFRGRDRLYLVFLGSRSNMPDTDSGDPVGRRLPARHHGSRDPV